ncbi:hypothetical protein Aduo_016561 [Ancylostoma duodenale]
MRTQLLTASVLDPQQCIASLSLVFPCCCVHCCAYVINLVVQSALETVHAKRILSKVKAVVAKLSRSVPLKEFYKRCLEKANTPLKTPVMDCPTRWGSTYDMLCTVLDSVTAFEDLLAQLNKEPLEHEELKLLESMRILLAPFHSTTKLVCRQRPNVSIYIGIGRILLVKRRAKKTGKASGEALLMGHKHYVDEWVKDEFLQSASLSDPRFAFLESIISVPLWEFVTDTSISLIDRSGDAADDSASSLAGDILDNKTYTKQIHLNETDSERANPRDSSKHAITDDQMRQPTLTVHLRRAAMERIRNQLLTKTTTSLHAHE